MKNRMKTQNGFIWLPLIIMIVAVAAFTATAVTIYEANRPISENTNTATTTNIAASAANTNADELSSNTNTAANSNTGNVNTVEVVTNTNTSAAKNTTTTTNTNTGTNSNTTKNTNGTVLGDAVEIYQDDHFVGLKTNKAIDTNIATANIVTDQVSAGVEKADFRASGVTFKFRIRDPHGVEGLGVLGYGPTWGFFNDTSAYYAPHRISGDQYDGEYQLVATQFNGHTLLNVQTDHGFFIAWRRAESTTGGLGDEYLYVGNNNTIYHSAEEVQKHTIPFASVSTAPEPVTPEGVSVSVNNAVFSTTSVTFRFHLKDPQGVRGISVRSFGNDWDPYYDAAGSQTPQLLSGDRFDGEYQLVATQLYGSALSIVNASKGFYLVWERNRTGLDREFFHVGKGNLIYRQYAEVQQTPIPFSTTP